MVEQKRKWKTGMSEVHRLTSVNAVLSQRVKDLEQQAQAPVPLQQPAAAAYLGTASSGDLGSANEAIHRLVLALC